MLAQHHAPLEVIVADNASSDGTREVLERYAGRVRVLANDANLGFAAAQNLAIRAGRGAWVLALNPDAILTPAFVSALLAGVEAQGDPAVGTACGRLMAMPDNLDVAASRHLDSTGIYFTPELRHLDRGCRRPDHGEYSEPEYVFGASGAAALYRREMIGMTTKPEPPRGGAPARPPARAGTSGRFLRRLPCDVAGSTRASSRRGPSTGADG